MWVMNKHFIDAKKINIKNNSTKQYTMNTDDQHIYLKVPSAFFIGCKQENEKSNENGNENGNENLVKTISLQEYKEIWKEMKALNTEEYQNILKKHDKMIAENNKRIEQNPEKYEKLKEESIIKRKKRSNKELKKTKKVDDDIDEIEDVEEDVTSPKKIIKKDDDDSMTFDVHHMREKLFTENKWRSRNNMTPPTRDTLSQWDVVFDTLNNTPLYLTPNGAFAVVPYILLR